MERIDEYIKEKGEIITNYAQCILDEVTEINAALNELVFVQVGTDISKSGAMKAVKAALDADAEK